MSTQTIISLPGNVRITSAALVIAKLLGCPSRYEPINPGQPHYGMVTRVDGITIGNMLDAPQVAWIRLETPQGIRRYTYLFESHGTDKHVTSPQEPEIIRVGIGLVDFFGGVVDFDDSDLNFADYKVRPKSNSSNQPQSDRDWLRLQRRIHALTPDALRHADTIVQALHF